MILEDTLKRPVHRLKQRFNEVFPHAYDALTKDCTYSGMVSGIRSRGYEGLADRLDSIKITQGHVDHGTGQLIALTLGSFLDVAMTGLTGWRWIATRASSMILNPVMAPWYGVWQNATYKILQTTPKSNFVRKWAAETATFATLAPLQYPIIVTMGMCMNKLTFGDSMDWSKIGDSVWTGFIASPLLGFMINYGFDKGREFFELPTSAVLAEIARREKAEKKNAFGQELIESMAEF